MEQKIQVKENIVSKLKILSKIASIIIIITVIIILSSWIFNISILPGLVTMESNTVISFLLGGISLYLWTIKNSNHKIRRIAQICAFIIVLMSLITLLEYLFNINLGIDQLFFKETLLANNIYNPNKMAPLSTFSFMLLGYALIFLGKANHIRYVQLTAFVVGFIGLFGFIGYVYSVGPLYGIGSYTPLALIFTLAFLILSLGIIFVRADYELMGIVTSNHFGGHVADSLLPPAIVTPLLLGSIILLGWKLGIYGTEFGISLMVSSSIVIFTVIIWWSANSFNKMDIKRENAEEALKEYHDHLENLIEERTRKLRSINEQLQSEITERKIMDEKIRSSLEEKELLLKEVHHRVKNNMQIISSLLSLQSRHIEDKNEIEVFKESQNRVKSMALVHEKLYRSKDFESIDFGDYINSLISNLASSYVASSINFNVNVRSISLDINNAIPCGLIINELITNSFKHAFPNNKSGEINIEFYKNNDEFILIISDNGIGFPEDLDFNNAPTLGLQLISTLVGQLDGTIELDRSNGTTFKISFKELMYKKRI